jgi:hypothetical protein
MITPVASNNYIKSFSNNANMQTPANNIKNVNIHSSNPITIPYQTRCITTPTPIAITPPNSITIDQNNNFMYHHQPSQQYQQHIISTPTTTNHQQHYFITTPHQQQQLQHCQFKPTSNFLLQNRFQHTITQGNSNNMPIQQQQQQQTLLYDHTSPLSSCSLAVSRAKE